MSIYQPIKTDLVGYVSAKAGATVPEADLTFTNVKPSTPEEIALHNRNTRCVATLSPTSTIAVGQGFIWYDRLDLSVLAKMVLIPRRADVGTSIYALLSDLRSMTGIPFSADDLVETFVVAGAGDNNTLDVVAKEDSLGWIGQGVAPFLALPDISTAFKSNVLPLF